MTPVAHTYSAALQRILNSLPLALNFFIVEEKSSFESVLRIFLNSPYILKVFGISYIDWIPTANSQWERPASEGDSMLHVWSQEGATVARELAPARRRSLRKLPDSACLEEYAGLFWSRW